MERVHVRVVTVTKICVRKVGNTELEPTAQWYRWSSRHMKMFTLIIYIHICVNTRPLQMSIIYMFIILIYQDNKRNF